MDKTVRDIALEMIEPNKFNPNVMSPEAYAALKKGMQTTGPDHDLAIDRLIVSPKNVFYNNPEFDNEHFVIIDGENRWKIAGELGWPVTRCEIRCLGKELARIMCYRRNRERGTIDPLLEAKLFQNEVEKGFKQNRIARAFNVTKSHVANRLSLLHLGAKTVKVYRKPKEEFKKKQLQQFNEKHEAWKETTEKYEEEGRNFYMPEPVIEEKKLFPRGNLTPSHLEAMASLPEPEQLEVSHEVLAKDLTVRETEKMVRRAKEELAAKKRLEETLKKAVRKKCPDCGGDPDRVDSDGRFRCGGKDGRCCYNSWDPAKSQKQVDEERKANMDKQEKRTSEARTERFKEARENPGFIRMPETPEELDELVAPWLLRKILQLTAVKNVRITGMRGEDQISIDYTPPNTGYANMSLSLTTKKKGSESDGFGFWVEKKDYKKYPAKSRVNLGSRLSPSEESRELILKFFRETVKTDKDPMEASET